MIERAALGPSPHVLGAMRETARVLGAPLSLALAPAFMPPFRCLVSTPGMLRLLWCILFRLRGWVLDVDRLLRSVFRGFVHSDTCGFSFDR